MHLQANDNLPEDSASDTRVPQLTCGDTLQCFQMVLPSDLSAPSPTIDIVPLSSANAQEMVALTTLAFPGFFRSRTCEMGSYYGVRSSSGKLIATGGERLEHDGYSEISAICTHPSFRGPSASFGTWCAIIVATAWSRGSTQAAPIIARSDCISEWGSSRSAKSLYIAYLARLSELALRFLNRSASVQA